MPKKTKKEKILARKHRMSTILPAISSPLPLASSGVNQSVSIPANYQFQTKKPQPVPTALESQTELVHIRHDLTKTIILAACAFQAELVLYWFFEIYKR